MKRKSQSEHVRPLADRVRRVPVRLSRRAMATIVKGLDVIAGIPLGPDVDRFVENRYDDFSVLSDAGIANVARDILAVYHTAFGDDEPVTKRPRRDHVEPVVVANGEHKKRTKIKRLTLKERKRDRA